MKKLSLFGCLAILALSVTVPGHAELINNGNGLIYDTGLNITWYDYSYQGSWNNAMSWAASLSVTDAEGNSITGWRLPHGTTVGGFDNNASEMGYLFYTELGNKSLVDCMDSNGNIQPGYGLVNAGPFTNLKADGYWEDISNSWGFGFAFGFEGPYEFYYYSEVGSAYALAVHDGDISGEVVAPTPIPGAIFLFGPGLVGLAALRRRFKG